MMNEAGHAPVNTTVQVTNPLVQATLDAFAKGATIRPQVPELNLYWSNFCGTDQVFEAGVPAADWVKAGTEAANQ
jgi:maltose-binding protein MalE